MISSDSITEIDGSEHGMVVERNSRLELTCRVTSGDRTPAFIIWQKENKVCYSLPPPSALPPHCPVQKCTVSSRFRASTS